jgi:hypothetical protein
VTSLGSQHADDDGLGHLEASRWIFRCARACFGAERAVSRLLPLELRACRRELDRLARQASVRLGGARTVSAIAATYRSDDEHGHDGHRHRAGR